MSFGKVYVTPARGAFVKQEPAVVHKRSFDYFSPVQYPPSFYTMVENCPRMEDYELLEKIVQRDIIWRPSHRVETTAEIDFVKQISEAEANELRQQLLSKIETILRIYGVVLNNNPMFTDHFSALQEIIHDKRGIQYTRDKLEHDINQQDFTFTSPKIIENLAIFREKDYIQNPIVILIYTEIGFIRVHEDDIDLTNAVFVIVPSQEQCLLPKLGKVQVLNVQNFYGERRAGFNFFQIVRFEDINGTLQPIVVDSSVAHFVTNATNFATRLDALNFPFDQLSGRSCSIFGLIGRYSVIKRHLSHFEAQVDVLDFNDKAPFIGMYLSKTAYIYAFLYIPNDLPPTHPFYAKVTEWASSFLHRVCTKTLFLVESQEFDLKASFNISGLPQATKTRYFGGFGNSLISHEILSNTIGERGRDAIRMENYDEVRLWREFITRRYQIHVQRSETGLSTKNKQLLTAAQPERSLQHVLNGITGLNELDRKIRLAIMNKHILEDGEKVCEDLIDEKMNSLTELFNQGASWMAASDFVLKSKCTYCDVPVDEKPGWDDMNWNGTCCRCKLQKIRKYNEQAVSHKPTQFLEDRVNEIEQNTEECATLMKKFRGYLSSRNTHSEKRFTTWFFEFWMLNALKKGISMIDPTKDIEGPDEPAEPVKEENEGTQAEELETTKPADEKESTSVEPEVIEERKQRDEIIELFQPDDPDFSLLEFISEFTGYSLDTTTYYATLPNLFAQVPFVCDADTLRKEYRQYFESEVIPEICQPPEISPHQFNLKCEHEYNMMCNTGIIEQSIVHIGKVNLDVDTTIDMEIMWSERNVKSGRSVTHTLYNVVDQSEVNLNYASKPAMCSQVVRLTSQSPHMFMVNAFHLDSCDQTLIVTIFGRSLWVNVVRDGYDKPFLPKPLLALEVDCDSGPETYASYGSTANLLVVLVKQKGVKVLHSILISRDYTTASVQISRPLNHLLPISAQPDYNAKLTGFFVRNDGKAGVLGSSYCYTDSDEEFAIIKFNPWTLTCTSREDSFDIPYTPLFISGMTFIVHSEKEGERTPKNSIVYTAPANGKRIDEIMGVINWRGSPRVMKDLGSGSPTIIIPDEDKFTSKYSFTQLDAVSIVSSSIDRFGYSETDRMGNGVYPEDSITVESVFDISGQAVNNYFNQAPEHVSAGQQITVVAHPQPTNNYSLMDLDSKPVAGDPKRSMFPFIHRCAGAPRFLVKGPMPPAVMYKDEYSDSILEASMKQRMMQFPPFTILREVISRGEIASRNITTVNMEEADGSGILNAFCGLQFVEGSHGSVRHASVIVPTEYNKFHKFTSYHITNALSYVPLCPTKGGHCALSLIMAIAGSGVVVICSSSGIDFILSVFKMMKDTIPTVQSSCDINFDVENLKLVVVTDLGIDEERTKTKLRDGIGLLTAGLSDEDVFGSIMNREILLISNDQSPTKIASVIHESVEMSDLPMEENLNTVCKAAALYGSFIDNIHLFEME